MELTRIIINENNDSADHLPQGSRWRADVPDRHRHLRGDEHRPAGEGPARPTPLTHDLLANTIDLLGGDLQDIYINELREHTYFAKLRIRHDGELVEVDSRPSDAIAVAVTVDVPIYVADDIIDEVGQNQ